VAGHKFTFDARPSLGIIDGEVLDVEPPRLCVTGTGKPF
jgi:hypothetical protein